MDDYFKLLSYAENHEERKIANDTVNNIEIDTCFADDIGKDYETGLLIDGIWYIAEDYDTKEEAQEGHKKYIDLILDKRLTEVEDIYNGDFTKIIYKD